MAQIALSLQEVQDCRFLYKFFISLISHMKDKIQVVIENANIVKMGSKLFNYNHFEISGTWRKTLLQKWEYKFFRWDLLVECSKVSIFPIKKACTFIKRKEKIQQKTFFRLQKFKLFWKRWKISHKEARKQNFYPYKFSSMIMESKEVFQIKTMNNSKSWIQIF